MNNRTWRYRVAACGDRSATIGGTKSDLIAQWYVSALGTERLDGVEWTKRIVQGTAAATAGPMATIVNFDNTFEMPLSLQSLEDFRRWSHSDRFPEIGRIDYVEGRIEVDMSPEDLFTHGTPKGDIFVVLHGQVRKKRLGHLFVDSTRIASATAELSAEPDIVFVSRKSITSDRVRLIPKASAEPGRYVELEGAVDLVVEIVSDSSETKDTQRLPVAYFRAGVLEFWLVDVRGETIIFQINRRGESGYEAVDVDPDGFQRSEVFGRSFALDRSRNDDGFWEYDLRQK